MAGDDGRKTISPYDLTTNDNPVIIITQVQLKGENYDEWAHSIRTAMRARKKFGFIDGTIKRLDETSLDLEDWLTINSLLVSWIRNTIEPTLRSTISHVEVAQDLWTDINERFLVINGPRIQQLKTKLANCKQKGLTIVNYYGRLKMLWDELANFEQMSMCKCEKCTCDLGSILEKKPEEEKVNQFLMGLDGTIYGTVRSNLLAQDPLPNLNRVYSTLIQKERVKTITRRKEERGEAMAFAAQSTPAYRGRGEWKDKNVGDSPRGDGKACGCGRGRQQQKMGHSGSRGRGGTSRANAVQTEEEGPSFLVANAGHTLRMLIGAGEQRDGLYYFWAIPSIKAMKRMAPPMTLWDSHFLTMSLMRSFGLMETWLTGGTGDAHRGHGHHQWGSEDAQNVQEQLVTSAK
ncbi:hypothetical protein RJ639_045856 [Escallonia herrerae]|uniref:Retrotransposon Copia-like N-terminal domain-containing protein n=1 Tax=Escallonia herrerae TaxID=1293975 RepID=A0AA88W6E1_9ASTE|nr:hypothetical protein RJ639_045856 [Escallonia herrerae]